MDLAARLHLKNWSYRQIKFVWWFAVYSMLAIVAVDFYIHDDAWFAFLLFSGSGILCFMMVVYSELKGLYRTRGGRYIVRSERPDKFRSQSNIHVFTGFVLLGAGCYFEIWSLYKIIKHGAT